MELTIFHFIVVGFVAQLIDGSLGMAYGVSSNTFLLSLGLPPASASASVHFAEVFTTGISGASHWRFGNVDWNLVKRLALPGVLGGVIGATILSKVPGEVIRPYLSVYLAIIGVYILWKAFRRRRPRQREDAPRHISILGIAGGFFDAIGGGGWGPIVTTSLIAHGNSPRRTVGSVSLSEFAVTLAESITFLLTLGMMNWEIVAGLLIGGVLAAPFGAYIVRRMPARVLMSVIGVLIILLSARTLLLAGN